jgi:hypothetical protein
MSSLEMGRAHERELLSDCHFGARIKPRQACNCWGIAMSRHRNESGGIYDDDPLAALTEDETQDQA